MNSGDDELLERALRDELSPGEEAVLAERLKREPDLSRRLVEFSRDEALLTEWAGERRTLIHEATPETRWSFRPLLAAAAILLIGILAVLLWPAPREASANAPQVVVVEGAVNARVGDRLEPGRSLRCGPGARAVLEYSDGTTLEIREKTKILILPREHSREVRLLSGSVAAQVTKLPPDETFSVFSPEAEARVLGTRFELMAGENSTRLRVEEGLVRFTKKEGGPPISVPAGHFATARRGQELALLPLRGSGLRGEYYDAPDLTHPKFYRIDPAVEFDWKTDPPDPSLRAQGFSVRWSGSLVPRFSETYTFTTISDDGARLWVNGRLLVDQFHQQGRTEHSAPIDLAAWEPVDLRIEYLNVLGPARVQLLWSSLSTPKQTIPSEALFPAATNGTGLKGEYYNNQTFTDLKVTRVDPTVDFDWGLSPPDPSMGHEYFSVRWTGQVEAVATEMVTFSTISDDGVRLWVDGKLLIDDWTVRGSAERSGQIDLVAGRRYDLKLEYFQYVSVANARLLWASAGRPQQVVPRECLFPAP